MEVTYFIKDGFKFRKVKFDDGSTAIGCIGDENAPETEYDPELPPLPPIPTAENLSEKVKSLESENLLLKTRITDTEVMITELITALFTPSEGG